MRFTLDQPPAANLVTHIGRHEIRVGEQRITRSVILSASKLIREWPVRGIQELDEDALLPALALDPEILILGTGGRISFPAAALYAQLGGRGIGLEVMDTSAACRTYNVLVTESRPVVAALILP